ncbi:STAS domain-containing protein [Amycolatopsis sp. lyj-90]|uniref:STAS domain-containing protein n=1 Tax=Amycolatopsis sp. lyj-90 TaxID=2789285 RepID=UPI00397AACCF
MTEPESANDMTTGRRAKPSAGVVSLDSSGETAVLSVSGALDLTLAPQLRSLVERAFRLRPRVLIIDLTAVEFLASVGMAELIWAERLCTGTTQVRIVADSRNVVRPLQLTGLTGELMLYPSRAAALEG